MKCPECDGTGIIRDIRYGKVLKEFVCHACSGKGTIQGYAKKAYSGKFTQLRNKVKSLRQSREDLIARVTELQGKLAGMATEIEQAVDLAGFYETQALENERLAGLIKQSLVVLVEFALSVTNAGELPERVKQLASFYRKKMPLPNPPLVDDGATDCKCAIPEQVSAEDETAIFEQKGDEADGK